MLEEICKKYWNCIPKDNNDCLKYSEFIKYIEEYGLDKDEIYFENINKTFRLNKNRISYSKFKFCFISENL